MLTLDPTLAPICAKVEWAKEHIRKLEIEAKSFLAVDPYVIRTEPDPNVPDCVKYFVESVGKPPPMTIALITGDALFNLRAALDHLAFQLAWVNGTRDEKILRATYFPIFDDAERYETGKGGKVRGMSQAAMDAIDAIKPYKGGNDVLWRLHRLNNIDKHRLTITVGAPLSSHNFPRFMRQGVIDMVISTGQGSPEWQAAALNFLDRDELTARPPLALRKCPLEAGDELELAFSPVLATDEDIKITFEVAFCEPQIAESQPIIETLKEMAKVIDNIILSFKPLFV